MVLDRLRYELKLMGRRVILTPVLVMLGFALIVARDFINNGRKRSTGTTPGGPEIYQDGLIRLEYILFKVCIVYFGDELTCHLLSSGCSALNSA